MNRKVLVTVLALAVVLLATPLVGAVPLKEKNNDEFQTYGVTFAVNIFSFIYGEHQYIPSMEKVNKLIISGDETWLTYDITIGAHTYHQGEDFIYTGHFTYTFYHVTEWDIFLPYIPEYVWPSEYHGQHLKADYTYEFLPASGIEGTLQMRAVYTEVTGMSINSLAGTGDLRNVQIKATMGPIISNIPPVYVETHVGVVRGWPE